MIKVNLLRNRGGGGTRPGGTTAGVTEVTQMDYDPDFAFGSEGKSGKDNIIKIILLLLGTGLLMVYEWNHLENLDKQLTTMNAQVAELDNQINNMTPEVEKAKILQAENDEINKKIKIVRDLGAVRLREIRAVDYIQNVIPDQVWLVSLRFAMGKLSIEAVASQKQVIETFQDRLSRNSNFHDVILERTMDQTNEKLGNLTFFTLSASLGERGK